MKSIFLKSLVLFSLFFYAFDLFAQEEVSLSEAIQKNWVQCQFQGNAESPHYIKPLHISIKNVSKKDLKINIPAGTIFASDSSKYQDVIVTKDLVAGVRTQQSKSYEVYSSCIQSGNRAPNNSTTYHLATDKNENLVKLAKFINQKSFYATSEAQHALWALSDDAPLEEIFGYHDKGKTGLEILKYVAEITGKPVPSEEDFKKYYQVSENGEILDTYTTRPKSEMSGKFYFEIRQTTKVLIGMFDNEGILIREIYNNPTCTSGNHTIEYAFDSGAYQDDVYHFKLITNEKIWLTMTMDKNKRN